MEATYKISEQDYVNAIKLFHRPTPGVTSVLVIAGMALLLVVIAAPSPYDWMAIFPLAGGCIGGLLFRFVVNPIFAKRHFRRYKAIQDPITIKLRDNGVWLETTDTKGLIRWHKILKWRHNGSYVLIYPMPRLFYIVPKTIGNSGFDIAALVDALQTNVGKVA